MSQKQPKPIKTIKSQKIRLYPTEKQEILLKKHIGYSRYCYNLALQVWNVQYETAMLNDWYRKPNKRRVRDTIKQTLIHNSWEDELTVQVMDTAIDHLQYGWKHFWSDMKHNRKLKFKNRHNAEKTFSLYRKNDSSIIIRDGYWYFLKNPIKMAEPVRFSGTIKTATVCYEYERWFISISVETTPTPIINNQQYVGLDWGVSTFITTSDGEKINAPIAEIEELETQKKRYQQYLARKREVFKKLNSGRYVESNQYKKARTKLSNIEYRLHNLKDNFLKQTVNYLAKRYSHIAIESLSIKNMTKGLKSVARMISKIGWYNFTVMLKRKVVELIKIDRFTPSSQVCHECGIIHPEMKDLNNRTLSCCCRNIDDRDINAAKNIKFVAFNI